MKHCAVAAGRAPQSSYDPMNAYVKVAAYLESFIDYEKKAFFPYRHTFKLARVRALMQKLGVRPQALRVIHIAGTKGKGSTSVFCASMFAAAGLRVGLYTSPHFFDFRERIQILRRGEKTAGRRTRDVGRRGIVRSEMIAKSEVVRLVEQMRPQLELARRDPCLGGVSFFEVYTALAFMYFHQKNVDYVVLETGLGGRLDATNVVTPQVSIITRIGLDHTDKLGATVARIAVEKAGIIKRNVPVISAPQAASAMGVLRARARVLNAPVYVCGRDFHTGHIRYRAKSTVFDFSFGPKKLSRCSISLAGFHQVENASLALMAVELLRDDRLSIDSRALRTGLRAAYIPGRFEVLRRRPLVVADIAHNPLAFGALQQNLALYFPGKKIILIFAASRDKDAANMINKIRSRYTVITSFKSPRAYTPFEIKQRCGLDEAYCAASIREAYALAARFTDRDSLILISGSLFLVAEAKKFLKAV